MEKEQLLQVLQSAMDLNKQTKRIVNEALNEARSALQKDDSDYVRGLNDAWELARKIVSDPSLGGFSCVELPRIFNGVQRIVDIFNTFSAEEALELASRSKGSEPDTIKVGDIVVSRDDYTHATVLSKAGYIATQGDFVNVYTERGEVELWNAVNCAPTGKHINISQILSQMGSARKEDI